MGEKYSCKFVFFFINETKKSLVAFRNRTFERATFFNFNRLFQLHATSVTYYESKDLTHDFEYPEKWKNFISVNWTTKEDDKDFVAGTLTLKQRV